MMMEQPPQPQQHQQQWQLQQPTSHLQPHQQQQEQLPPIAFMDDGTGITAGTGVGAVGEPASAAAAAAATPGAARKLSSSGGRAGRPRAGLYAGQRGTASAPAFATATAATAAYSSGSRARPGSSSRSRPRVRSATRRPVRTSDPTGRAPSTSSTVPMSFAAPSSQQSLRRRPSASNGARAFAPSARGSHGVAHGAPANAASFSGRPASSAPSFQAPAVSTSLDRSASTTHLFHSRGNSPSYGGASTSSRRSAGYQRPSTAGQVPSSSASSSSKGHTSPAFARFPETQDGLYGDAFAVSVTDEKFENQRLREELQQLKQAFVSKLRGSNKFVSGGQFRSNKRAGAAAGSTTAALRSQVNKLRGDNRQLRTQVADMQQHIQRAEAQAELWATQQAAHTQLMAQLNAARQALETGRRQRAALQVDRDALTAQVRKLQELLTTARAHGAAGATELGGKLAAAKARIEELAAEVQALQDALRKQREAAEAAARRTPPPKSPPKHEAIIQRLRQQVAALEAEARKRNAAIADLQTQVADGVDQLETAQAQLDVARAAQREAEAKASALEWDLASATAKVAEAGLATVSAEKELELARKRQEDMAAARAQLAELERQLSAAHDAQRVQDGLLQQANVLAEATEARLQAEKAEVRLAKDAAATAQAAAARAAAKLAEKQQEIDSLCQELHQCKVGAQDAQGVADNHSRTIDDLRAALNQAQRTTSQAQARLGVVETQLAAANAAAINAQKSFQQAKKKVEAEALERTLQSMVRLCVVAPTVNVQVGASKQVVSCKPHLPHEQLQHVIQNQVLPKFVAAFLQSEEAAAPDGSPLQSWLRRLAGDMQRSIEMHLQKQFAPDNDGDAAANGRASPTVADSAAAAAGRGGGNDARDEGSGSSQRTVPRPGSGASRRPPVHHSAASSAFSSLADRRPRSGRRRARAASSRAASPVAVDAAGGSNGDAASPANDAHPGANAASGFSRPSTAPSGASRRANAAQRATRRRRPGSGSQRRSLGNADAASGSSDDGASNDSGGHRDAAFAGADAGFMQSNGLTAFARRSGRSSAGSPANEQHHTLTKPRAFASARSKSSKALRDSISYGRSLSGRAAK